MSGIALRCRQPRSVARFVAGSWSPHGACPSAASRPLLPETTARLCSNRKPCLSGPTSRLTPRKSNAAQPHARAPSAGLFRTAARQDPARSVTRRRRGHSLLLQRLPELSFPLRRWDARCHGRLDLARVLRPGSGSFAAESWFFGGSSGSRSTRKHAREN